MSPLYQEGAGVCYYSGNASGISFKKLNCYENVIPAEAGIQKQKEWILVFTGMTHEGIFR
ncbi:MAG: hypothetical protein KGI30_08670 [Planctomycetota bacterium]|nr:hypothetical protein [Planctomycetota bacterium]